jgi:transketolase
VLTLPIDDAALAGIAAGIGADGPMCLHARAAWAEGRGDVLTFENGLPPLPALLVNPGVPSSTGAVYRALDAGTPGRADRPAPPADWRVSSVIDWLAAQRNDLQAPAVALAPAIGEALSVTAALPGVRLARMSGSGATVFALFDTIAAAKADATRPTLICCRTVIGKGAPTKQGTADTHGAALGDKEVAATREALGWTAGPFEIPADICAAWDARARGSVASSAWRSKFQAYEAAHPDLAKEFTRRMDGGLPAGFEAAADAAIAAAQAKSDAFATRKASQNTLNAIAPALPELVGGSADLMGSVFTDWSGSRVVLPDGDGTLRGNIVNFGVREFAMAAITNGLALHGGFIPETGTFLTFSDYSRNAIRMAALMGLRNVFVFTHDSIGLGEDGPTHQSVEQVSSLRLIPNLDVWRPCDGAETAVAWKHALTSQRRPTLFALSRQGLPPQPRTPAQLAGIARGGYVLAEADGGKPAVVLIATGSEVALAMAARTLLAAEGIAARVVSMPCTSVFDAQDAGWRTAVLPRDVPRVAIEAGVTDFWRKYVGAADDGRGAVLGLDRFGESAPAGGLFKHFGFTPEAVAGLARSVVAAG